MFLSVLFFESIIGINWVAAIFLAFPALGLIGLFLIKESEVFQARKEIKHQVDEEKSTSGSTSWLHETLQSLKIPIWSPSVYRPLLLSVVLFALGSTAGATYINKFIIQILNSEENVEFSGSNETKIALTHPNDNNTIMDIEESSQKEGSNEYILPLVIQIVKLIIILLMTFLLQKLRVRFLYFTSLIFTVILLVCLGFVCDESFSSAFFSPSSIRYIKTVLLCLHIVVVQLGLHTLPGLLMDVIYPSSCKAVVKGLTVSIVCVNLIVLIFILKSFSYSHAFWIMAGILFTATPFMYMFVPEVRNIGTETSALFFVPSQTVFFFVLPENRKVSEEARQNAQKNWKKGLRQISATKVWKTSKVIQEIETEEIARKYPKVTFDQKIPAIESIISDEVCRNLNEERVSYVSNILSQNGYLCKSPNESRVLVGRGPIKFKDDLMKNGSIFLFSDVLIVAKRLVTGRRYVGEMCFKLTSPTFTAEKNGAELIFAEEDARAPVQFEDESLACVWEKYINFVRSTSTDTSPTRNMKGDERKEDQKKNQGGALELMEVRKNETVRDV